MIFFGFYIFPKSVVVARVCTIVFKAIKISFASYLISSFWQIYDNIFFSFVFLFETSFFIVSKLLTIYHPTKRFNEIFVTKFKPVLYQYTGCNLGI